MAPNIATPMMKPVAFATVKTRLRNSLRGTIGSGAYRSRTRNSATNPIPAKAMPMICGDCHAKPSGDPPRVVTRSSAEKPTSRRPDPR